MRLSRGSSASPLNSPPHLEFGRIRAEHGVRQRVSGRGRGAQLLLHAGAHEGAAPACLPQQVLAAMHLLQDGLQAVLHPRCLAGEAALKQRHRDQASPDDGRLFRDREGWRKGNEERKKPDLLCSCSRAPRLRQHPHPHISTHACTWTTSIAFSVSSLCRPSSSRASFWYSSAGARMKREQM